MVVVSSFTLVSNGHILASIFVLTFALLTDLLDGTMARISERGASVWGNFLDSTLDRISDAAILIGLTIYLHNVGDSLFVASMVAIPLSTLVSYTRAKAESLNIECKGGFAERTERLVILGIAGLLHVFGFSWAMDAGVWVLLVLTAYTVLQRMAIVWRATR